MQYLCRIYLEYLDTSPMRYTGEIVPYSFQKFEATKEIYSFSLHEIK